MEKASRSNGGLAKYLLVYACILAISALQIPVAYSRADASQVMLRMLLLTIVQAGLAITFFMHMKSERRTLTFFLLPAILFILAMMNMIWVDSYRLSAVRPFAH